MFVLEEELLRKSELKRNEWQKTAEELRALGDACIEIAEQMEGRLKAAKSAQKRHAKAG